jgi:hypothetical protein
LFYIAGLKQFGKKEYDKKYDRKLSYEEKLKLFDVTDETLLAEAEHLRRMRRDLVHEKAVEFSDLTADAFHVAQHEAKKESCRETGVKDGTMSILRKLWSGPILITKGVLRILCLRLFCLLACGQSRVYPILHTAFENYRLHPFVYHLHFLSNRRGGRCLAKREYIPFSWRRGLLGDCRKSCCVSGGRSVSLGAGEQWRTCFDGPNDGRDRCRY